MTARPNGGLQIGVPLGEQQREALELALAELPWPQRREHIESVTAAAAGEPCLAGLLQARRGGRLVAAIWTQLQPGRTAGVWPPRLTPGEASATARLLLGAALEFLERHDVRLAQSLLPTDTGDDARLLQSAGFRHATDLVYLVSVAEAFPTSPPVSHLEFEPVSAASEVRLVSLIEATYHQTKDCPWLNDVRQVRDVLDGYRATGSTDAAPWLIVRHQEHDVGCLLLTDQADVGHWELVYMGLVPSARGRGWGLDMVRHAQWLTRLAGRERLVLAVDAANGPAINIYAAAGFVAWDRRSVFLYLIPPSV